MRVSFNGWVQRTIENLSLRYEALQKIQGQVASSRRINHPSDDPAAAVRVLAGKSELAQMDRYLRNAQDATGWLSAADSALGSGADLMLQAREIALRGSNSTLDAPGRAALAAEVDTLMSSLEQTANSDYGGQYLFAGTESSQPPFALTPGGPGPATYAGNDQLLQRVVTRNVRVTVSVPGSRVFNLGGSAVAGAPDAFTALAKLKADLEAGNLIEISRDRLQELDAVRGNFLAVRTEVGARLNQLELIQNRLTENKLTLTQAVSEAEDVNLAEALVRLQSEELAYQAATAAAGKLTQQTLLDFLR